MPQMQHMPAPWMIRIPTRGPVQIKSRHGHHVAEVWTIDDARVMAAGPELLAAVRAVANGDEDAPDLIRVALAKVEEEV